MKKFFERWEGKIDKRTLEEKYDFTDEQLRAKSDYWLGFKPKFQWLIIASILSIVFRSIGVYKYNWHLALIPIYLLMFLFFYFIFVWVAAIVVVRNEPFQYEIPISYDEYDENINYFDPKFHE